MISRRIDVMKLINIGRFKNGLGFKILSTYSSQADKYETRYSTHIKLRSYNLQRNLISTMS